MKVAIIGHKQIPGRSGGVEVVVEELSTRMVNLGHEVVAYNRKIKGMTSPRYFAGVSLVDVFAPNQKGLNALVYSYIATIKAVLSGADVIHYHALGPAAALWLAKLFRKHVVVTVHGLNYKTPKWKGFGAKYIKFGESIALAKADEVIVLSKAIQNYFEHVYGRKCVYLPNGLSMPDQIAADDALRKYGLLDRDYVLNVSRLVPGKGLELLVEEYKKITSDVLLVIAGDSEHVDEFKSELMALASEDSRIRFLGFVAKEDLCALYEKAKLFVFPSEAEGMPMSLLEAMWFNCPCLVSDIDENIEVLDGHGRSFHVCDGDDFREQLVECLLQPPAHDDTRAIIERRHNWDSVALETVKIYEKVLQ